MDSRSGLGGLSREGAAPLAITRTIGVAEFGVRARARKDGQAGRNQEGQTEKEIINGLIGSSDIT